MVVSDIEYSYGYGTIILHKFGELAESSKLKVLAKAFPNTVLKANMLHAINCDNHQQSRGVILPQNTVTVSRMASNSKFQKYEGPTNS